MKNLDSDVSQDLLYDLLSKYGEISSFRLNSRPQATFAYAAYYQEAAYRRALQELDGAFHFGSHLKVEPYRTPEQRKHSQRKFNNENQEENELKELCVELKEYLK